MAMADRGSVWDVGPQLEVDLGPHLRSCIGLKGPILCKLPTVFKASLTLCQKKAPQKKSSDIGVSQQLWIPNCVDP